MTAGYTAPEPRNDCRKCIKGWNGLDTCRIYGKLSNCFVFEGIPPGWRHPAAAEQAAGTPTEQNQPAPVPPPKKVIRRIRPVQEYIPYDNNTCPVCGKRIGEARCTAHCPRHRATVCMEHCYNGCVYLNAHSGHCQYYSSAAPQRIEQNEAACIQ